MIIAALLGTCFFAFAAIVGVMLGNAVAETLPRFEDGPPVGTPPVAALVIASAVIGAIVATHSAAPAQLLLIAVVTTALVAAWCCDVRTGIVPDYFTLGPLGVMLAVGLWQHEWWLFLSAIVPFVPFAIAATFSRGLGMGWGDVKLVALGGAVLGAQLSLLAFALACLSAVAVAHFARHKRGAIAFAPYLVAAIGIAIPLGMLR